MNTYKNIAHKRFMITICMVVLVFASLVTPIVKASTSRSPRTMHVKSIEIQDGDSLWSIAKSYYNDEFASIEEYVEVIKASNNMTNDVINTGNYLIIPYYS